MGEQRSSWYVRGKDNQPTGPFTAEELLQSVRAGRLDLNTVCWCEGMSAWLPLGEVKPFASVVTAVPSAETVSAGMTRPSAPQRRRQVLPASLPGRRRVPAAWLAAMAGGLIAACAVVAYIVIAAGSAMPTALRYLPDGTRAFICADVAAICDSKLYAGIREKAGVEIETADQNLKNEIGIASSDVSRVSVGLDMEMSRESPGATVVVELKTPYTADRVPSKWKPESVGDFTFYRPEPGSVAMYIADKQTLVFADPKLLRNVLERNGRPKLPAALEIAIKQVAADRSNSLYAAAIPPENLPPLPNNPVMSTETLKDIEAVTISASLVDDLSVAMKATCKQEASAEKIDKQLNGLLALAGQMGEMPEDAKKILDSIKIGHSGLTASAQVAGIGDKVVAALLLPAVQAAREAARRAKRENEFKQAEVAQAGSVSVRPDAASLVAPEAVRPTIVSPKPPSTQPFTPQDDSLPRYVAPAGLRTGIDRLLRRCQQNNDLPGNLSDYRVVVPPSYSGNENQYEIGLRSNSAYYVFHTFDGGQTWAPGPPTNRYLAGNSGKHSSRSPRVKPPQTGRSSGEAEEPETRSGNEKPQPEGSLSGTWQAAAGARFRIRDDGQSLRISLAQSGPLRKFTGELTRSEDKADSFAGTLDAVFRADTFQKQYSIRVTATLDAPDHLRLKCSDWPVWNNRGKNIGTKTLSETWTRQQ
jgi:hypothetical protein